MDKPQATMQFHRELLIIVTKTWGPHPESQEWQHHETDTQSETASQKLEGSAEKPPTPMALKCIIEMSKIDFRVAQAKPWPQLSSACLAEVWLEWSRRTVYQHKMYSSIESKSWKPAGHPRSLPPPPTVAPG